MAQGGHRVREEHEFVVETKEKEREIFVLFVAKRIATSSWPYVRSTRALSRCSGHRGSRSSHYSAKQHTHSRPPGIHTHLHSLCQGGHTCDARHCCLRISSCNA